MVVRAEVEEINASRCSATSQKTRVFYAQRALSEYYRHERMDWHTNSMPKHEDLDPERQNGKTKLNQISYHGSLTFPKEVATEKKQTPIPATKLNATYSCVHLLTKLLKN